MIVSTVEDLVTLDILSVVKISPLESLFKERFKGYIDVGFNLEKANQFVNWIVGMEMTYRTIKWEIKAEGSSYQKSEENIDNISRHKLSLSFSRLMRNRWQLTFLSSAQHNSELELKLRSTLGVGAGRNVVQTTNMLLLLIGGVVGTREQNIGSEDIQHNAELLGGINFQAFRRDHPRLDTSLRLLVFPSVTDFGRIRAEFDGRVRYELFKDFFTTLRLLNHFDSRAGDDIASKNDYGIEITLSYSFR